MGSFCHCFPALYIYIHTRPQLSLMQCKLALYSPHRRPWQCSPLYVRLQSTSYSSGLVWKSDTLILQMRNSKFKRHNHEKFWFEHRYGKSDNLVIRHAVLGYVSVSDNSLSKPQFPLYSSIYSLLISSLTTLFNSGSAAAGKPSLLANWSIAIHYTVSH